MLSILSLYFIAGGSPESSKESRHIPQRFTFASALGARSNEVVNFLSQVAYVVRRAFVVGVVANPVHHGNHSMKAFMCYGVDLHALRKNQQGVAFFVEGM